MMPLIMLRTVLPAHQAADIGTGWSQTDLGSRPGSPREEAGCSLQTFPGLRPEIKPSPCGAIRGAERTWPVGVKPGATVLRERALPLKVVSCRAPASRVRQPQAGKEA